jgi:hypothetical protein
MAKLTKAQREFFYDFAKNDLSNILFPILHAQGLQLTPELAESLLNMVDLDAYTEIVVASQQVSDAVNDERIRILAALIPVADEEALGLTDEQEG